MQIYENGMGFMTGSAMSREEWTDVECKMQARWKHL